MTAKELEKQINITTEKYFSIKNNPHEKEKQVFLLWKQFIKYPSLQYPILYKNCNFRDALYNAAVDVFKNILLKKTLILRKEKFLFFLINLYQMQKKVLLTKI